MRPIIHRFFFFRPMLRSEPVLAAKLQTKSRRILASSIVMGMVLAASGPAGEAPLGLRGKKLIEYGWDVPTPAQMRDEISAMEKRPFDGLIFRLSGGQNAFVTN